ncbi:hypothetical protein [Micromonospora sp. RTGN7]|uniref:hypothetical protein n=1 Tax=Micromonospora sp. RTGN7 TaxID=3016526 RepID=UPI0029FF4546|nr:hypothetical protein [Micromonospora sp. RTGN7]
MTVVVWAQTPVTGRAYRLVRFGRDFPGVRVHAAGPGWIEPLPPPSARLTTLTAATTLPALRGRAPFATVPGRGAGVSPTGGLRGDQ